MGKTTKVMVNVLEDNKEELLVKALLFVKELLGMMMNKRKKQSS